MKPSQYPLAEIASVLCARAALAQSPPLPASLSDNIAKTGYALRFLAFVARLNALEKAQGDSTALAEHWEDACHSTPGCMEPIKP